MRGFDFGENWRAFSEARLDERRLEEGARSMRELLGADTLRGKSFVDVGCGSGLFSLAAAMNGAASVVGFDVNPASVATARRNLERFRSVLGAAPTPVFMDGSVLDPEFLRSLGRFNVVYSWGVLHHTGRMREAIRNAAGLVGPRGTFAIAIYNRHWTSAIWKRIKRLYNASPAPVRRVMERCFGSATYVRMRMATGTNPLDKERGMDFWFDVVDWLGGYPYEYASRDEMTRLIEELGFRANRVKPTQGWTGCNEFVFSALAGRATLEPPFAQTE